MHSAVKVAKHFIDGANGNGVTDMTLLKLMKITYVAHGWMLGVHGRPLVSEDIEAWKYGPVIPELYRETKQFGREPVTHLHENYDVKLDKEEESIVGQVFDHYSDFTSSELATLTHTKGTPWDDTVKQKKTLWGRHYDP